MAKICIDGEYFEHNRDHRPMAEMLVLEKMLRATYGEEEGQQSLGTTYGEWESGLNRGSAEAVAVLIWLTWKRNGREKPLAEILASDINLGGLVIEDDEPPGPTVPAPPPEASNTTAASTSPRSRKSA